MKVKFIIFLLIILINGLFPQGVRADQKKGTSSGDEKHEPDFDEYMALLEFLGEWEIGKGLLINPEDLDQMPLRDEEKKDEKKD